MRNEWDSAMVYIFETHLILLSLCVLSSCSPALRVWQLSNATYGYRSDGVPPLYPQGPICGKFATGTGSFGFPSQAVVLNGSNSEHIDVEMNNFDIRSNFSITLHLFPTTDTATVFGFYTTGHSGLTHFKLIIAHGRPCFMMFQNGDMCGYVKATPLVPLNNWSNISIFRKHGTIMIIVNTTRSSAVESCDYGSSGSSTGTLRFGGDPHGSGVFAGRLECFVLYDSYIPQGTAMSNSINECSSPAIYKPPLTGFHACDETLRYGYYVLEKKGFSPYLHNAMNGTYIMSLTRCAGFCSRADGCLSFSILKNAENGNNCLIFHFKQLGFINAWDSIENVRYYIRL